MAQRTPNKALKRTRCAHRLALYVFMTLVSSAQISAPKIIVSPPLWALMFFWVVFSVILFALTRPYVTEVFVKYALIGIWCLSMFGVLRNQLKGNYLATMQANNDGLYFQTRDTNQYFYVPWKNVGVMEKAIFPLNSRGLRIEVIGETVEPIKNTKHVGNVRTENGLTFVYTIPQLRDRDKLIKQLLLFKMAST